MRRGEAARIASLPLAVLKGRADGYLFRPSVPLSVPAAAASAQLLASLAQEPPCRGLPVARDASNIRRKSRPESRRAESFGRFAGPAAAQVNGPLGNNFFWPGAFTKFAPGRPPEDLLPALTGACLSRPSSSPVRCPPCCI